MIFKPLLVGRILSGQKTQTRRPVKDGETECRYRPGRSYAVQSGRGKPETTRIIVIHVHKEMLAELSDDDARAEGFKDCDDFFAYWRELYKTGPLLPIPVWVIEFVLLARQEPRLLHVDSSHGYTSDPRMAMVQEPEAVDEKTAGRFAMESDQAKARRVLDYEDHLRRRPLEDRLAEVRTMAQENGTDISRGEAKIAKTLTSMERAVLRDRAA